MKIFFFLILNLIICSNSAFAANREVYVAKYKHDKICAISYTFDDGLAEHYTIVFPELENGVLKELLDMRLLYGTGNGCKGSSNDLDAIEGNGK